MQCPEARIHTHTHTGSTEGHLLDCLIKHPGAAGVRLIRVYPSVVVSNPAASLGIWRLHQTHLSKGNRPFNTHNNERCLRGTHQEQPLFYFAVLQINVLHIILQRTQLWSRNEVLYFEKSLSCSVQNTKLSFIHNHKLWTGYRNRGNVYSTVFVSFSSDDPSSEEDGECFTREYEIDGCVCNWDCQMWCLRFSLCWFYTQMRKGILLFCKLSRVLLSEWKSPGSFFFLLQPHLNLNNGIRIACCCIRCFKWSGNRNRL